MALQPVTREEGRGFPESDNPQSEVVAEVGSPVCVCVAIARQQHEAWHKPVDALPTIPQTAARWLGKSSSMSRGILYVAVNSSDHVKQVCLSVWSLRSHEENATAPPNVTLVTDARGAHDVETHPLPNFKLSWLGPSAKIRALQLAPYDMTLFLDTTRRGSARYFITSTFGSS